MSKKKSSSSTSTSTQTTTVTPTDNSNSYVDQEGAGQAGYADVSNLVDSTVSISIANHGLSGEQLSELVTPAAGALESISRDSAATRSAVAAVGGTISNVADAARETVGEVGKVAAPLAVGAVVYYMLKKKRKSA